MTSRPWISQSVGGTAWDSGVPVPVDEAGWPLEVLFDNGVDTPQLVKTLMLRDLGFAYPAGQYTLMFEGDGSIEMDFDAVAGPFNGGGTYTFNVTNPTDEGILLTITHSNPANPVRGIHVILPGFAETWRSEPFNPDYLRRMAPFQAPRLGNWGAVNEVQTQVSWGDRTLLSDAR